MWNKEALGQASLTILRSSPVSIIPLILHTYLSSITDAVGRNSSVGTATRYGLDGPGIEFRWGAIFSAPVQIGPGAYPASCTIGTGSLSRG
jgi:hypothetical protein